jgi:hypothetical protein
MSINMRRGEANACVVCDDLDFDSLLVEERRGEERSRTLCAAARALVFSAWGKQAGCVRMVCETAVGR